MECLPKVRHGGGKADLECDLGLADVACLTDPDLHESTDAVLDDDAASIAFAEVGSVLFGS